MNAQKAEGRLSEQGRPHWAAIALMLALGVATGCDVAVEDPAPPLRGEDAVGQAVHRRLSDAVTPEGRYISFREHLVDDQALSGGLGLRGADGLELADIDRDGSEDIVAVHEDSSHLRISFRNGVLGQTPDDWTLVTLSDHPEEVGGIEDLALGDIDGDGFVDVLGVGERYQIADPSFGQITYFQNPGGDPEHVRSTRWQRLILPSSLERGSWIKVYVADFDQDGRPDVSAANKGAADWDDGENPDAAARARARKPVSVFTLEGEPLKAGSWHEHRVFETFLPVNARPVDLDGDGDLDMIAGSRLEGRLYWLENTGAPDRAIAFDAHEITPANRTVPHQGGAYRFTGMSAEVADLNGDGRVDIVLQEHPFNNVWLEQPEEIASPWPLHVIAETQPDIAAGILLVDVNGDGALDLMSGGYSDWPRDRDRENVTPLYHAAHLAWFENPSGRIGGDAAGKWIPHYLSRRVRGMYDMFVARDLDRDGDIDLVGTRGNTGELDGTFWLEQVRTAEPEQVFRPARERESGALPLPDPRVRCSAYRECTLEGGGR